MPNENLRFKSEYQGFEDDYVAEMLKMRLSFSRANFDQVRLRFAMQLRSSKEVA